MKLQFGLLCFAILVMSSPLASAEKSGPTAPASPPSAEARPSLQVIVNVPPSFQPFLEDDIAQALAWRLEDMFRRQGYQGAVIVLERPDEPKPELPLLEVMLSEWRLDLTDNVQCTFTARLTTREGEENLGIFSGTGLYWTRTRDRWRLASAFEDSANDAMKDLYRKIASASLLPGFRLKRR